MIVPKAAVFDLGKVLLNFDYRLAAGRLSGRGNKSPEEIVHLLLETPILLHYECGRLQKGEFFGEFCKATGYGGSLDEFTLGFGDIFTPIPEMIDLQAQLRRASVPTYVFSNTNELAVDYIRRHFPFFNTFDGYILSYEHGSMKPDPRLYEVVEASTGRMGPEILYVDDRLENIQTAAARHWQAILHEQPAETRRQVELRGLLG